MPVDGCDLGVCHLGDGSSDTTDSRAISRLRNKAKASPRPWKPNGNISERGSIAQSVGRTEGNPGSRQASVPNVVGLDNSNPLPVRGGWGGGFNAGAPNAQSSDPSTAGSASWRLEDALPARFTSLLTRSIGGGTHLAVPPRAHGPVGWRPSGAGSPGRGASWRAHGLRGMLPGNRAAAFRGRPAFPPTPRANSN